MMKSLIKPASLLFYLLVVFTAFIPGVFYSGVLVNLTSYSISPEAIDINHPIQENPPIGLGMFAPNQSEEIPLYFYGNPNLDKSILEHSPYDSITFMPVEVGGFTIATAPPWLMPHHMKLDYGVLYFKVVGVTEDFLEVVVNSRTNQTAFIDRRAGKMMYWPDFFHSINSVELIGEQKVYVKPLDHAGTTSTPYSFLRPVRIRQQWMEVRLVNDAFEEVGKGWIRWHADGQLLISYNLFS